MKRIGTALCLLLALGIGQARAAVVYTSGLSAATAISATDTMVICQNGAPSCGVGIPLVYSTAAQLKTFMSASPTLVTPILGVATGTSIALSGCTIGTDKLCVTGTTTLGATTIGGTLALGTQTVSGNFTASGVPIFSGLSTGTIASGKNLGLDSGNHLVFNTVSGGSGCTVSGAAGIVLNNGSNACTTDTSITASAGVMSFPIPGSINFSTAPYITVLAGNNIFLGFQAGPTVPGTYTGGDSTSLGGDTLNADTSGDFNIAIGNETMLKNTAGSRLTCVGFETCHENLTNNNITALGDVAAYHVTADNVTAIGQGALGTGIGGAGDTAVGGGALDGSTGANNVGIGQNAGSTVTSGNHNTCIGPVNACNGIVTGSNNTIIGGNHTFTDISSDIVLLDGAGNIRADYGLTTSSVWTFAGAVAPHSMSIGWIAAVNPNGATIGVLPAASTITSIEGVVETATGGTATVSVNIAASGTACSAGTTVHSGSFNANGTAATNQTLTVTTTAVPAHDRLCLVTTGTTTWTGGTGVGGITVNYTTP